MKTTFAPTFLVCTLLCILTMTGCSHLGPQTVDVDRFDYSTAISESWKQQTLLNIVKLRYADLPVFVDVASIVSGYSMETSVNVGGQISSSNAIQGNSMLLGGAGKYTDRPTITYVPMTGEKFLRGLLAPIDPKNIFIMLQAGYPADFLLGLTVESLNGVRNRSAAAGAVREADPDFVRALELIRQAQALNAVGTRLEKDPASNIQTAVLLLRSEGLSPEAIQKTAEIRRLLKLTPDRNKFTLTYSPMRTSDSELAVNSRSMLQIMTAFASYIDVPDDHVKSQTALTGVAASGPTRTQPIRIHSGKDKPEDAYAAVRYRNHWFWIDQNDWQTKRALTAVVFFFTLADTGNAGSVPLITIPAQ
jgi:hypothetical protein